MNLSNSFQRFRLIAFIEGISFLVLLFVAMPLKYAFHYPLPVKYAGWIHGVLFVLYGIALLHVWIIRRWKFTEVLIAFFASLIPFGTFWLDKRLMKKEDAS
jgi:integral membrane protein